MNIPLHILPLPGAFFLPFLAQLIPTHLKLSFPCRGPGMEESQVVLPNIPLHTIVEITCLTSVIFSGHEGRALSVFFPHHGIPRSQHSGSTQQAPSPLFLTDILSVARCMLCTMVWYVMYTSACSVSTEEPELSIIREPSG